MEIKELVNRIQTVIDVLELDVQDQENLVHSTCKSLHSLDVSIDKEYLGIIIGGIFAKRKRNENIVTVNKPRVNRHFTCDINTETSRVEFQELIKRYVNEGIFKYVKHIDNGLYYIYSGKSKQYTLSRMKKLLGCDRVQFQTKELSSNDTSDFEVGKPCGQRNMTQSL
jgi:hypothetical protein